MKRIAFALGLLAVSAHAAPWDGVRGGLTVVTASQDMSLLAGIVPTPGPRFWTLILVSSANTQVNNIRITINYRDDYGNLRRASSEGDRAMNGTPLIPVWFPIKDSQIDGAPYIEARTITINESAGEPLPPLPPQ